ncbi:MAG: hypothetical protein ACUVUC_11380 [Thermoguttaceae bacterium]
MSKPTTTMLSGLIAVAVSISAAGVLAEPLAPESRSPLDRSISGRSDGPSPADKRQQADDLLHRARQAMAENDLETAGRLIARAEALDVSYGPMHFGDTPKKARRDLERRLQAAGKQVGRPGAGVGSEGVPADPFAARGGLSAPFPGDSKTQAKLCIFKARRELDQGNVLAAGYWYREALKHPATFGPYEDSPERLAADIRRAGGSLEEPAPGAQTAPAKAVIPLPPTEQIAHQPPMPDRGSAVAGPASSLPGTRGRDMRQPGAGELLLEARRALALGDLKRATSLVQQASSLNVHYRPTDDTPEKVQALISRYAELKAQRADRGTTEAWRREHARVLMDQADGLLRWRDLDEAERLATEALRMRVQFSPYEPKPEKLLEQIAALRRQARAGAVVPAGAEMVMPAAGGDFDRRAARAVYDPANDPTRNIWASSQEPGPRQFGGPGEIPGAEGRQSPGLVLYQQGEAALRAHDTQAALELFRQAYQYVGELDPMTARRLQDHLQMLTAAQAAASRSPASQPSAAEDAAMKQQLLARQLAAEVAHQENTALRLRQTDPKGAMSLLEQARAKVEAATLDSPSRDQLLRRIDRDLAELRQYIAENQPRIDLEERNQQSRQQLEDQRRAGLDAQNKFAQKVDEIHDLVRERRFAEAEVLAKQALELMPDSPVAQLLVTETRILRHYEEQMSIKDRKEDNFLKALESVDIASIPFPDQNPYVFPEARQWRELTGRRAKYARERGRRMSERELEIREKLKTPVSLQFENAPLSKVVEQLAKLAGINLYLDPQGLAEEGVTTDTPINIDLQQEIKLESALNLILRPLRLTWVIKDEVLKITSEQARRGELYTETYNVADLVIPIPNFVPHGGLGLDGAYRGAMANVNYGAAGPFASSNASPIAVVASRDGRPATGAIDPAVLAQLSSNNRGPIPTATPISNTPGNLGGAAMADFDSLMDLIQTTVAPDSWVDAGGTGDMAPFEVNLSLVVTQTQEVHEQIVDLLQQLRRMQDLQVTIEVRFITLNDNFFERIGVDFDFFVNDNIDHAGMVFGKMIDFGTPGDPKDLPTRDIRSSIWRELVREPSATVGWQGPLGQFTADLDIPFQQNSFGLATPQFGGFDPTAGVETGFAILSDIEAFFFINAAQGDRRSNVLQAPKVTLFNGQMAFVSDTSQSPFVISVIPVVADFASAQQPVIVILSEGTFLSVQAVVSNDKRFVRLTLVPFFSQIGKVETFTFQGTETTIEDTSTEGVQDVPNDNTKKKNQREVRREGTTVQLPTFSFVTVSTTVSVPDGGTVLMGGIKRLSEGRNEFGVPILNKIPYLNRLFKNVGIGRETQSLMMMVTPRIIITEEEEEHLLGTRPAP